MKTVFRLFTLTLLATVAASAQPQRWIRVTSLYTAEDATTLDSMSIRMLGPGHFTALTRTIWRSRLRAGVDYDRDEFDCPNNSTRSLEEWNVKEGGRIVRPEGWNTLGQWLPSRPATIGRPFFVSVCAYVQGLARKTKAGTVK